MPKSPRKAPRKKIDIYSKYPLWLNPAITAHIEIPNEPLIAVDLVPSLFIIIPLGIANIASPKFLAPIISPMRKIPPPIQLTLAGIAGANIPIQIAKRSNGI